MKITGKRLIALGTPLILAVPTRAAFTGLSWELVQNPYTNTTADLYATFDGAEGDFVFAVSGTPLAPLFINTGFGQFYQNPFGDDLPPNPLLFPLFPSLEFDTFVTIGRSTSVGDVTTLAPGWPGFGPDRLAFDDTGWYITPDDPQGIPDANNRVLLARLSLVTFNGGGSTAFFGEFLVNGFSNGEAFQHYVAFKIAAVPGPGGLAALGVAGLVGTRRRRSSGSAGARPCRISPGVPEAPRGSRPRPGGPSA